MEVGRRTTLFQIKPCAALTRRGARENPAVVALSPLSHGYSLTSCMKVPVRSVARRPVRFDRLSSQRAEFPVPHFRARAPLLFALLPEAFAYIVRKMQILLV